MQGRVFISYRKDDTSGESVLLKEAIERHLPESSVFLDHNKTQSGEDYRKRIERELASTDVFLCLIGPRWANASDASGNRRLNDADDLVRIEIVSAIERGKAIIPVLVNGAQMPKRDDLPPTIWTLTNHQGINYRVETKEADAAVILKGIRNVIEPPAPAVPVRSWAAEVLTWLRPAGKFLGLAAAVAVVAFVGFVLGNVLKISKTLPESLRTAMPMSDETTELREKIAEQTKILVSRTAELEELSKLLRAAERETAIATQRAKDASAAKEEALKQRNELQQRWQELALKRVEDRQDESITKSFAFVVAKEMRLEEEALRLRSERDNLNADLAAARGALEAARSELKASREQLAAERARLTEPQAGGLRPSATPLTGPGSPQAGQLPPADPPEKGRVCGVLAFMWADFKIICG